MRRPQPRATGRVVDLTRDPMAPPELVTKAILDGLDKTARQMERKWGIGRLRLLVDDALRAKFDAQKAKLDAAIATDQEIYVRAQAAGMRRAWQVLDGTATEAGAQGEEVRQVRRTFPGSAVVDVRPREPPPPPIDWARGDELPF
jgi:hypothetical protein